MKYKDKNITIEAPAIPFYDVERPTPALIELFNPQKNNLRVQSQVLITRVNGILHEIDEPISFGIADVVLHTLMPVIIYSRKRNKGDMYFSLSNQLVIQDHQLAKDLLLSAKIAFFDDPKKLIDAIFQGKNFVYIVCKRKDEDTIFTAIDKLSDRKGAITIHNPEFMDTTPIKRYCIDRDIHLIENADGSADIFRF